MTDEYKTVDGTSNGAYTEKKSRFIANVFHIESEDEAIALIEETKKKYWDARHNCYAYIVGSPDPAEKQSDDGEPSRTAGAPILAVLKDAGLRNVLCIVTRYFGGVLLGTGGLTRAYRAAAKEGVEAANIKTVGLRNRAVCESGYGEYNKLLRLLSGLNIAPAQTDYVEGVKVTFFCTDEEFGRIEAGMRDATAGECIPKVLGKEYVTIS